MSRFFKPYEGARPFLFISYAHRQSNEVLDTIRILHDKGVRLWYDEGIPAGSDWPSNIAHHMQDCERVIFFLSARAMESPNCFSEIRTAHRLGKPLLVVRLEDAPIEGPWVELLEGKTVIPLLTGAAERADAILRSRFVPGRYHRSIGEKIPDNAVVMVLSLLLFLAAAGALGALATGRWNPFPPPAPDTETVEPSPSPPSTTVEMPDGAEKYFAVVFPDYIQERGFRRALSLPGGEIYRWQLSEARELCLCGTIVTDSLENVVFEADGGCRVNGAPTDMGPISDLSLFEYAVRLEKLALVKQPLSGLSRLNGLQLLRELCLAGSTVDNLNALDDLPSLQVLRLEHTGVRDLRGLERFPYLHTVTVSRDMLPLTWSDDAPFAVVLVP